MKKIYATLLMVFSVFIFAQDNEEKKVPKKNEIEGFKLYPNPAFEDEVQIVSKKNAYKNIVVYDVFGEEVLRKKISTPTLDISRLIPGVYLLQATEEDKTMTRKLVVK